MLPRVVRGFAERVERHRRDPATAEAPVAWPEADAHVDPLRDDTPCRWLAPRVLERLQAARDGRIARERAHAMIVALIPAYPTQRGAARPPGPRWRAVPGRGPAFPVSWMNNSL